MVQGAHPPAGPWHASPDSGLPRLGWDAVTVPGAVSVWVELSTRYGKLPFADLFDTAIHYAEQGYAVGPVTARQWQQDIAQFDAYPEFAHHFRRRRPARAYVCPPPRARCAK